MWRTVQLFWVGRKCIIDGEAGHHHCLVGSSRESAQRAARHEVCTNPDVRNVQQCEVVGSVLMQFSDLGFCKVGSVLMQFNDLGFCKVGSVLMQFNNLGFCKVGSVLMQFNDLGFCKTREHGWQQCRAFPHCALPACLRGAEVGQAGD